MNIVYKGRIVEMVKKIYGVEHDKFIIKFDGQTLEVPHTTCQKIADALSTFNKGDRVKYRGEKFIVASTMNHGTWYLLNLIGEPDNYVVRGVVDASQCKKILKIEANI